MAATYGFRAYIVEAFPNRFKDREPLAAQANSMVRKRIAHLLEEAHLGSTRQFPPRPAKPGEPDNPTETLTVGDPADLHPGFIHVMVEAGVVGSHTNATKIGAAPQDLSDRSAEAAHIFSFFFSERKDTKFVVIAETINGRDPMRRLMTVLRTTDVERQKRLRERDKQERRDARAAGTPLPEPRERVRLALRWYQASDDAYLAEILGSAKRVSAVFKSHKPSSRGGSDVIDRTLTIALRDGQGSQIGGTFARLWARRQRSGETTARSEGVSELAGVLEEQDLFYEDETGRYDDAALRVVSESGARTTIAIDTLRDVFTYPVHNGKPSARYFYSKVAERLPSISREAGVRLRKLDESEVREWLAD